MNLILFGFKGCGKSYYGKKLAEKIHRPFVDTDQLILESYLQETGESLTIREIYGKHGEEAFRVMEKRAIAQLPSSSNTIISLGGGAILDPENRKALQQIGEFVYLQASVQTIRRRMMRHKLPSYLRDETEFDAMYAFRLPIYESIPAHRIELDLLDEPALIAVMRNILIFEEPLIDNQ